MKSKRKQVSTKKRIRKSRSTRKLRFRSAKRLPRRSEVVGRNIKKYKGGNSEVAFPASFSQSVVDANPQSYLPVNTFSHDPNYSVVDARLTAPFLTGVSSGGRRGKLKRGGSVESQSLSNILSNTFGQLPSGGVATNMGGVTNIASNLSGTSLAYNSNPSIPVPLA